MADSSAPHEDTPVPIAPLHRALGRVYIPDPRDAAYRLADSLPRRAMTAPAWKTTQWMLGRGLAYQDQGYTSRCVEYGVTHLLMLAPIVRRDAFDLTAGLYEWAQDHDQWEGSETAQPYYDGTSVRAGLQGLRHRGLITEFRTAATMDEVRGFLTLPKEKGGGPLVVGTDWWTGMDNIAGKPSTSNWWTPDGIYRGGHCWVVSGFVKATATREAYYLTGNSHAGNYRGRIRESDLEYLLFLANGDVYAITERPKAA